MDESIRHAFVFGGVYENVCFIEMALNFPVGHGLKKIQFGMRPSAVSDGLPERLVLF